MGGVYSVQNTKEMVTLAKVVTVQLVKGSKVDGFQLADLAELLKSPEFLAAVGPALADASKIVDEAKEVDFMDGLELGKHVYSAVMEVLDALK